MGKAIARSTLLESDRLKLVEIAPNPPKEKGGLTCWEKRSKNHGAFRAVRSAFSPHPTKSERTSFRKTTPCDRTSFLSRAIPFGTATLHALSPQTFEVTKESSSTTGMGGGAKASASMSSLIFSKTKTSSSF